MHAAEKVQKALFRNSLDDLFSLQSLIHEGISICINKLTVVFGAELLDDSGHSPRGRSICKCPNSGWRNGPHEGEKGVILTWELDLYKQKLVC